MQIARPSTSIHSIMNEQNNTPARPAATTATAAGSVIPMPGHEQNIPVRIGQFLVDDGIISRDCLEVALVEQKQVLADRPESAGVIEWALVEIISRLNVCPIAGLREALGKYLCIPTVDLSVLSLTSGASDTSPFNRALDLARTHTISTEWMRHSLFLPFAFDGRQLCVAMGQPQNLELLDTLRDRMPAGLTIRATLALGAEIAQAINRLGLRRTDPRHQVAQLGQQLESSTEASTQHQILVSMIDKLLEAALFENASDIHFAPSEKTLRVLFRIDGVLQTRYRIHPRFAPAVSVRIKVLANLDISETRLPQDGGFKSTINGMGCDLRISTLPTQFGESVVMRLHGRDLWRCDIEKSGLPPVTVGRIRHLLRRPHGLVLIAGPTGSGKSSTLYAMVKSLNVHEKNVVTLEDPIEYSLGESIRQTGINESIGLSFGTALRSTLRQDPDVIMIGEIRDNDTAQMSLRMAMTGHLVLATIHCDSALSVHLRLRLLGLEPELFANQLVACMSQRLARVACVRCSYLRPATDADCLKDGAAEKNVCVLDVRGCDHCRHTGYQGRRPILELLEVNTDIADLIAGRSSRCQLRTQAESNGFVSLHSQTLAAVRSQSLTPSEAIRVAG